MPRLRQPGSLLVLPVYCVVVGDDSESSGSFADRLRLTSTAPAASVSFCTQKPRNKIATHVRFTQDDKVQGNPPPYPYIVDQMHIPLPCRNYIWSIMIVWRENEVKFQVRAAPAHTRRPHAQARFPVPRFQKLVFIINNFFNAKTAESR